MIRCSAFINIAAPGVHFPDCATSKMEAPLQLSDVDVWIGTSLGTLKGL